MKTKNAISLFIVLTISLSAFAQNAKIEKFNVKGNCGMCEARIEKAAKSVEGVESADWDKETKQVTVKYDPGMTDLHKIHMAIAKAGHDTDLHKADKETYEKLPSCCKYQREENHDHDKHKGHGDHK